MLIDDDTADEILFDPAYSRGAEPRDLASSPPEMFSPPAEIPPIPRSEWDARIDEQERRQSSLEHLWRARGYQCLDQNGQGFCWAYSTAHAIMLDRLRANQPHVRLSAHAVACKITDFRDKGGWCGLSAKFAREYGYPSVDVWPEKSMNRRYDTATVWDDARRRRITSDFVDLTAPHFYYQNLTFDQVASCLLQNLPCPTDYDWWGHSVCAVRLVRVEAGSYGLRILNQWWDSPLRPWGDSGFATLRGGRSVPNSALAIRATTLSA